MKLLRLRLIFLLLMLLLPANLILEALPSPSHVAHGKANVVASGNELLVEAADRTVLNYENFDIQRHETVRFHMAESTHRVLNRVCSDMPSHIDGKLLSNGIVYLLNPAGILFGPDSVVNVASLYAAAAHLSDQDFIRGIDRFSDIEGYIDIYGTISAQEVALIGKSIFQRGNVLAEEGQVLFVTAEHVYIGKEEGHLFVKCERQALQEVQEVQEKPCFLESGIPAAFVLHHTGTSKAKKIHFYAEDESLVKVSGNVDVYQESAKGGKIEIQGEVISLEGAVIEASGSFGGGEVWIGGGKHGEGLYPTAQYTVCDEQTSIHTDAVSRGNGGEIVLWADKATIFDAKLFSRGGAVEGNGGYIETSSGDRFRAITGRIDASAVNGKGGQWDLDPCSVTISSTAGANTPAALNCTSMAPTIPSLNDGCACAPPMDPACGGESNYIVTASCLESVTGPTTILIGAGASTINDTYIALGDTFGMTPAIVNITNPDVSVTFSSVNAATAPHNRGTIYLNGVFSATGTLTFSGNTLITGDTTIHSTAGAVTFDDPINASAPTPPNLTVEAAGAISFGVATGGAIGAISPLGSLTATTTGNNDIGFAAGAFTQNNILIQSSTSPATNTISLYGASTFSSTSGNITFDGILNSNGHPIVPRDLTLNAAGNITFGNSVGAQPLANVLIESAANVTLLSPTIAPTYKMVVGSFTQLAGTGATSFQGPLITSGAPVPQAGGTPPSPPKNGGDVSITTAGDINFYYLVQVGGVGPLTPVLVPGSTDTVAYKSVITTTGGRQLSSVSTLNNPNAPNGLNGGSVTLNSTGGSINLLGIYAGGTPAFPGTSGTGGHGGDIFVSSAGGTTLRGPIFATGGAGVSGGSEVLPSLIFSGQNFDASGTGSPGDIEIQGALTLGFNGIILRGGNITIGDIQSSGTNLLGIDASTSGLVQLGALNNLSYFDVDYAKGVLVSGPVSAEGLTLFNAGDENIEFKDPVVSTDITAIANDFCVIFDQGYTTSTSTFLNCGHCPQPPSPPSPPPSPPSPPSPPEVKPRGRGFAGVWYPSFDVYYYPGNVFYNNDDGFLDLSVSNEKFYLDFLEKPVIVERLK